MSDARYILLTAARNEEDFIEATLRSVLAGTTLPVRWVIISDGSTDGTDAIVSRYAAKYFFIRVLRLPADRDRSFASKAEAIRMGYESVKDVDFDFICNVDADIVLPEGYHRRILSEFDRRPNLGVASGRYVEGTDPASSIAKTNPLHLPGSIQVFRRQCFEQIGGYPKLRTGGEDTAATVLARMHGWETEVFPELKATHLRPEGTGGGTRLLRARIRQGAMDYNLGMHPVFMLGKSLRRMVERPFIIGSAYRCMAYFVSWILRKERDLPEEFVTFFRREQWARLGIQRWTRRKEVSSPASRKYDLITRPDSPSARKSAEAAPSSGIDGYSS